MKKLFGTDGMRGEAGRFPLDAATIETVGASLARRLREKLGRAPSVVIGRDTRESSGWLEQALVAGLARAGATSKSAGVITTPGVAFLARSMPADAGVVISASHNAYRDNGVKIFAPSGTKLDEETERLIERDVFAQPNTVALTNTHRSLKVVETDAAEAHDLRSRYVDFLADEIGRDLSLRGMSLVLDCANGAAFKLAPEVFERLGASVSTINNQPDGRNINLGSGALHPETLQAEVVKRAAHLGVAFDGDADRALFVDGNGRLVNGDGSLWVLARYLKGSSRTNSRYGRGDRDEQYRAGDRVSVTGHSACPYGCGRQIRAGRVVADRRELGRRTVRSHYLSEIKPRGRWIDHHPHHAPCDVERWQRPS